MWVSIFFSIAANWNRRLKQNGKWMMCLHCSAFDADTIATFIKQRPYNSQPTIQFIMCMQFEGWILFIYIMLRLFFSIRKFFFYSYFFMGVKSKSRYDCSLITFAIASIECNAPSKPESMGCLFTTGKYEYKKIKSNWMFCRQNKSEII